MKLSTVVCGSALAVLAVAGAGLFATETPQAPSAKEQEMMKKWAAFATPGEAHKHFLDHVGKWSTQVKMWHEPGQPPMESAGMSDIELIMDGRYLVERATGNAMGEPFSGIGTVAYDNLKKKYVSTWIDNMGTGIMTLEGTCDASANTCTYYGESPDVMSGNYKKVRAVMRKMGADKWAFEMYDKGPDGKEWKNFEIIYTRKS